MWCHVTRSGSGALRHLADCLVAARGTLPCPSRLPQVDKLFRIQHSDPWVNSDPHRTARTISIMNNRTSGACLFVAGSCVSLHLHCVLTHRA